MSDIKLNYNPFEFLPPKKRQKKLKIETISATEIDKMYEKQAQKQKQLIEKQSSNICQNEIHKK